MNTITIENNQANILARAIDCHIDGLSAEVAQFIVSLSLAQDDEARMSELAEKAREGHLTANEEAELEEFRRCGRLMEMLKLKAHKVLRTK
jgi:hypothetical protein